MKKILVILALVLPMMASAQKYGHVKRNIRRKLRNMSRKHLR